MNWTLIIALAFFVAMTAFLLFHAGTAIYALILFLIRRRKNGLKNKDNSLFTKDKKIL